MQRRRARFHHKHVLELVKHDGQTAKHVWEGGKRSQVKRDAHHKPRKETGCGTRTRHEARVISLKLLHSTRHAPIIARYRSALSAFRKELRMAGVASPPFLANTAAIHSAKPRAEGEPTEDDAGVLTTLRAGVPGPLCSRKTHNNIIRGGSSPHENRPLWPGEQP
jgi:hypothetical protein